MEIGYKIKELRKKLGLTQDQLALKSGISKNAIWNYENNKREPSIDMLKKIAEVLDVSFYDLVGYEPENIMVNKNIYRKMSDEELSNLLKGSGFKGDVFKKLSLDEKDSFKENLKEISPISLKIKNYIDNFDNVTKEEFINLCNDINDYHGEILNLVINEKYLPLLEHSNWQEKAISDLQEMLDKASEIIGLQSTSIDTIKDKLRNYSYEKNEPGKDKLEGE